MRPTRKKFQEVLKVLKSACKRDDLPMSMRIRAAEVICAIYGVPLPERKPLTRTVTKEAVPDALGKQVREQVRDYKKEQELREQEEERNAEAADAARAFLDGMKGNK